MPSFKITDFSESQQRQIREQLAPRALDRPQSKVTQPNKRGEGEDSAVEPATESLGFRITFIRFGRKSIDGHDNLASAFKPMTDLMTTRLGFKSDSDERLQWEFSQVVSRGRQGCIVKIERTTESEGGK